MKKEVIKENGFLFAKISDKEFKKLNSINFDRMSISYDEIDRVKEILNVTDNDDLEYVRAIRNSVVKYYADRKRECIDNKEMHGTYYLELIDEYQTKMSTITCALDTILEF